MNTHTPKIHKVSRSGSKFDKKKEHIRSKKGIELEPNRGKNPRAFLGASNTSHKNKQFLKSTEKKEHSLHIPKDTGLNAVSEESPLLVGVVGPRGSGKTTLIRSMVKFYSHQSIKNTKGPITVNAGKYRRITFIECPNSLNEMCDLTKVVDVVLLMIDGSFGFEMETFEFLSMAQVHGMPRIMGIITHLDLLKTNKSLRCRKNMLRHRFWNEVATGAKILTLAPIHHGIYRSNDVMKLHRLLVTIEVKTPNWNKNHGSILVDRYEDLTDLIDKNNKNDTLNTEKQAENTEKDMRTIAFYGYVRGYSLKSNQLVHMPGVGDFIIKSISLQTDPCPPIVSITSYQRKSALTNGGNIKMRHLTHKQKKLYAPYTDLNENNDLSNIGHEIEDTILRSGEGFELMKSLKEMNNQDLNSNFRRPISLLPGSENENTNNNASFQSISKVKQEESSSSDDDILWPETTIKSTANIKDTYSTESDEDATVQLLGGAELHPRHCDEIDTTIISKTYASEWGTENENSFLLKIKNMFVTGNWAENEKDANGQLTHESNSDTTPNSYNSKGYESISDDENKNSKIQESDPINTKTACDNMTVNLSCEYDKLDNETQYLVNQFILPTYNNTDVTELNNDNDFHLALQTRELNKSQLNDKTNANSDIMMNEEYNKKKILKKQEFDAEISKNLPHSSQNANSTLYLNKLKDDNTKTQNRMIAAVEEMDGDIEKKIALIGFFPGLYVRIVIEEIPIEFVKNFNPSIPLILGGLSSGDDRMALLHIRLKRHRWFPRIMKAQDPVIVSCGWRRIQTQPIFATEEQNGRHRYLKYTPEHLHCLSVFYGPLSPPQSGIVCLVPPNQNSNDKFRVMATGYTISVEQTTQIVKKLKLTGFPQKIHKTNCFVKGLFNSDLEAAMFVGSKLKCVSGLRGIIKKVVKGKNGLVRCTFEDKILQSDIVFVRTWKPVLPPYYCVTVQNLLNSSWQGMRTMKQLRSDFNLPLTVKPNSEYQAREKQKEYVQLTDPTKQIISRSLRMNLPFDLKEDYVPLQPSSLDKEIEGATTVAPELYQQKRKALINMLADRSEHLAKKDEEIRSRARKRIQLKQAKELAIHAKQMKRAKKETSRMKEFRSQKKTK